MTEGTNRDLSEGIAPRSVEHQGPDSKKTFKPWHKPRKQWVRCRQWSKETESLLPQLQLDGRPLRYLSLPGEDMLDIRVLADLCGKKRLRLKCLGFDESARDRSSQTEMNISLHEVINNIEPTSVVWADNIAVLKNKSSQGFRYVRELGPFDIVNLDLCASISSVNDPTLHQALSNVCEYQLNYSREPWLLFLTTRAESSAIYPDHLHHYLTSLSANVENSPCFGNRLASMTGVSLGGGDEGVKPRDLLRRCTRKKFVRFFAAGFSKWLLPALSRWSESASPYS